MTGPENCQPAAATWRLSSSILHVRPHCAATWVRNVLIGLNNLAESSQDDRMPPILLQSTQWWEIIWKIDASLTSMNYALNSAGPFLSWACILYILHQLIINIFYNISSSSILMPTNTCRSSCAEGVCQKTSPLSTDTHKVLPNLISFINTSLSWHIFSLLASNFHIHILKYKNLYSVIYWGVCTHSCILHNTHLTVIQTLCA